MKEEFVTLEIAKKLKEKGYNGKTKGKHVEKIPGTEREEWDDAEMMYVTVTDIVTYPNAHIYDVLKWLREEKQLFVEPSLFKRGYEPYIQSTVFEENKDHTDVWRLGSFHSTYEEAALAGIEYTLDNLI